ncbi:hypothetical protein QUA35_07590 [Microcoleus sp. N9_B2]|uniref:hypothetical protein n=1 Tax=unclassified Microcoleus TaxID=2642155 RepID=UPI002FCF3073
MSDTVKFIFGLLDSNLEDEERRKFASKLLPEVRDLDAVVRADRAEDLYPEVTSKGLATLVGMLTAEVSVKNITAFFSFLNDRLVDKTIKLKVKLGEKEVEIEAKSRQELAEAERTILNLIAAMGGTSNG